MHWAVRNSDKEGSNGFGVKEQVQDLVDIVRSGATVETRQYNMVEELPLSIEKTYSKVTKTPKIFQEMK